jgi:hypothetical protein
MRRLIVALVCLAPLVSGPSAADPPVRPSVAPAPPGWEPSAPRAELRQHVLYVPDGGPKRTGAFLLAADKEGLHGWWHKTFPVAGGKHYRFRAVRKSTDIPVPRRAAAVRIFCIE